MINNAAQLPSLGHSVAQGAIGFGLVSLCVFATVAFAERWMYRHLGMMGAYLTWTLLFIVLGGTTLGSLVVTKLRLPKFYLLFAISFFAYATGWVVAYFTLGQTIGEWVGSLIGSLLMAVVFAAGFGATKSILKLSIILFVANSIGYFAGSALNNFAGGRNGMLIWGLLYGICLGGGIGAVLQMAQLNQAKS